MISKNLNLLRRKKRIEYDLLGTLIYLINLGLLI